jgi:daunorubicin resistance ABC transporter ATP-binding subunit
MLQHIEQSGPHEHSPVGGTADRDHAGWPEGAVVTEASRAASAVGGPAQDAAIEVADLVKVYPGGKTAVNGVSFRVARGEIFGFLGPNGSGKTTTVRILSTLQAATSGKARVGGFDVGRQPGRVREMIGYAGQFVGVDDDLSVTENLLLGGSLHRLPRDESRQRTAELLDAFSLGELANVRAARLSGGLRRRLDLAQALVHQPSVLFLDEPTTGLDPQSRNALWQLLRHVSEQGTTVFLTTQYLEEADRTCDRVAIIDAGRLVKVGAPTALKQEVGGGRLTLTIADEASSARAREVLAAHPSVTRAQSSTPGDAVVVYVDDAPGSVAPVLRLLEAEGIGVDALEQAQASLDDVFLRYTGARPRVEARVEGAGSGTFGAGHGHGRRH